MIPFWRNQQKILMQNENLLSLFWKEGQEEWIHFFLNEKKMLAVLAKMLATSFENTFQGAILETWWILGYVESIHLSK